VSQLLLHAGVLLDGARGANTRHLGLMALRQCANVERTEPAQETGVHGMLHGKACLRQAAAHVQERCARVGGPACSTRLHSRTFMCQKLIKDGDVALRKSWGGHPDHI